MRASVSQPKRKRLTKSYSLPAPVKGLNTRDPLPAMDETYALSLTNFISTAQGCAVRQGYKEWATGFSDDVETLMTYRKPGSSADTFFACSGASIYDITLGGAIGAAVQTGLANARFDHVNFLAAADAFLVICNGEDAPRHYNGTSWTTWVNDATPSSPGEVDGVNVTLLRGVITHQRRLWFIETGTARAWYLPVNSIGGTASGFDFGPFFPRGGRLKALASWTTNGGTGMQNSLVAISEKGDVVIYEGTDPSDADNWRLAGTWKLGPPVGDRCTLNWGSELFYMSQEGLMPLSRYLSVSDTTAAITDAIRTTVSALSLTQDGIFGWHLHHSAPNNLIILNVPQISTESNVQFVLNTITNGWSVFTGWPAICWGNFANEEYFGSSDAVYRAFYGYRDNVLEDGSGGSLYSATAQTAFSYFNDRVGNKRITLVRINVLSTVQNPAVGLGITTDFQPGTIDTLSSTPAPDESTWNTGQWGSATWRGGLSVSNKWKSVTGFGYTGSLVVTIPVQGETVWASSDLLYERGGVL